MKKAPAKMNKKSMAKEKMKMVTVKGKKVPAFAADGKGKNDLNPVQMKKSAMKMKKESMAMMKKSVAMMKKASAMKMKMEKSAAKMKKK